MKNPEILDEVFVKFIKVLQDKVQIAESNFATKQWDRHNTQDKNIEQLKVDYKNAIVSTIEEVRKNEKYNDEEVVSRFKELLKNYLTVTARYFER